MVTAHRTLSIFFAAPSDVVDEKYRLERVVEELNRTWSDYLRVRLRLLTGEKDVHPAVGEDAQAVINSQIGDDYDVFFAVMWTRFGSRTKRAPSGTYEEFQRAFHRHRDCPGSVEIMFYFRDAKISPSKVKPRQLENVRKFKSELGKLGVCYCSFSDLDEFDMLARMHLGKVMIKRSATSGITEDLLLPTGLLGHMVAAIDSHEPPVTLGDLLQQSDDAFTRLVDSARRVEGLADTLAEKLVTCARRWPDSGIVTADDVHVARRIAEFAAAELEGFVLRLDPEVRIFSTSYALALDALSRSAVAIPSEDSAQLERLSRVIDVYEAVDKAFEQFGQVVRDLDQALGISPALTPRLSTAERAAADALKRYEEMLGQARKMTYQTLRLLKTVAEERVNM